MYTYHTFILAPIGYRNDYSMTCGKGGWGAAFMTCDREGQAPWMPQLTTPSLLCSASGIPVKGAQNS